MNNTPAKIKIIVVLIILAVFSTVVVSNENATVALITKTIQDVTMKSPLNDWAKAAKGNTLISGTQVKTGQKSLAVVKFIDNSILRVRELSLLTLNGQSAGQGVLSKTIQLDGGTLGFDVKKQKQNEQFRLTSPTSVASIRGTKGKLSGGRGNDTLTVTEGLVNLKNNYSNNEIDVPAGFIGFSNQDGTVTSRKATDQELADADNTATGDSLHELDLELKGPNGNKKELKIRYKKQ